MPRPPRYAYSLAAPFILSLISSNIASHASTLEMDAPQPIAECAEDTFTWQGGLPPYTLSLRDADSGSSVFSNSGLTDTVFHWVAAVAAGTNLILELTDTGENGAGGARISESFTVEAGDDSCLANSNSPTSSSSSSTSAPQQTSDGTIIPSSTSPSPSSSKQPTASETSSPLSESATQVTEKTSPPSTGTGALAGTRSTETPSSSRTGPDGSSTTPSPGAASGSPDPSSSGSTGGSTPGAIAGAAVGSLVAGIVLAAGLFCLWRARRAKRGRGAAPVFGAGRDGLEPYDPARPVRQALPVPEHDRARDLERGSRQQWQLGGASDPDVREIPRPRPRFEKGHLSDGSESALPSISVQATTTHRAMAMAGVSLPVNGANRSCVVDVDGAGGEDSERVRSGDLVGAGRRWGCQAGEVDDSDALDLADYSAYSTASTAPPPYSQVE